MASHLSRKPLSERDPSSPDAPDVEHAFDALVETHYSRLCTFALQLLGAPDAAEDAVQDVLCKVWSARIAGGLQDPVPYLYRAVRNQCLMVLRRERRWKTIDIEAAELPHDISLEDRDLFDLQDAIARGIAALPERTRLVFTMHRQQDLTYADIARILGISIKTVETQMTRALKLLRRRLTPFFSLGAVVGLAARTWLDLI
jgi:RNA polymerase sigma-70 factor (ECF subfamily)